MLLTLGVTLVIEGLLRSKFGVSGLPYPAPAGLDGVSDLGFMMLPDYRAWVVLVSVLVCGGTWWLIERTKLGSLLRAGTENPRLVEAFGINVPLMVTLTYAFGVALAALAGVLAAPVMQVSPLMGQHLIIVVFAVVVIGGMGSILGAILTGLGLGVIEGLTKVIYPQASSTVVFVIMALVLLWLLTRAQCQSVQSRRATSSPGFMVHCFVPWLLHRCWVPTPCSCCCSCASHCLLVRSTF